MRKIKNKQKTPKDLDHILGATVHKRAIRPFFDCRITNLSILKPRKFAVIKINRSNKKSVILFLDIFIDISDFVRVDGYSFAKIVEIVQDLMISKFNVISITTKRIKCIPKSRLGIMAREVATKTRCSLFSNMWKNNFPAILMF